MHGMVAQVDNYLIARGMILIRQLTMNHMELISDSLVRQIRTADACAPLPRDQAPVPAGSTR